MMIDDVDGEVNELVVHLRLLGEHLEVVAQPLVPRRVPTVNLALQRLVEVVVELV